jgi:hypothetical protein
MSARPLCRHCNARPVNRPRGLCWPCFYTPGVPDLYPAADTRFSTGRPGIDGDGRPPATPTPARQGTPEKLDAMAERAARGESLFHTLDGSL